MKYSEIKYIPDWVCICILTDNIHHIKKGGVSKNITCDPRKILYNNRKAIFTRNDIDLCRSVLNYTIDSDEQMYDFLLLLCIVSKWTAVNAYNDGDEPVIYSVLGINAVKILCDIIEIAPTDLLWSIVDMLNSDPYEVDANIYKAHQWLRILCYDSITTTMFGMLIPEQQKSVYASTSLMDTVQHIYDKILFAGENPECGRRQLPETAVKLVQDIESCNKKYIFRAEKYPQGWSCGICLEDVQCVDEQTCLDKNQRAKYIYSDLYRLSCGHIVHKECIVSHIHRSTYPSCKNCPICRKPMYT